MKNTLFNFAIKMCEEGAYLFNNENLMKYIDDYIKTFEPAINKPKKTRDKPIATPDIIEVVEHLNKLINKKFSPHTSDTIKYVGARLKKLLLYRLNIMII